MKALTIFVVQPSNIIYVLQPIFLKIAPMFLTKLKSLVSLTKQYYIRMAKPTSALKSSDPALSNCRLPIQLASIDIW